MRLLFPSASFAACCIFLAGCGQSGADKVQGYVEGEFVYVASPMAGALESLRVQRGMQVKSGDPLFSLESGSETAARNQAARLLAQSQAQIRQAQAQEAQANAKLSQAQAQVGQQSAQFDMANINFNRDTTLYKQDLHAISKQDLDTAKTSLDAARAAVEAARANVEAARADATAAASLIGSAQAGALAFEAALAKADWDLSQKIQAAPKAGLVFDTLYREGEWVAAGKPVVSLLPPEQIKVRAFVPEPRIGAIRVGEPVRVSVDGAGAPLTGKVSFISPQAEYTPPVIYSRESRSKLVFMVEVVFDPKIAVNLHPGQPVDVQFGS